MSRLGLVIRECMAGIVGTGHLRPEYSQALWQWCCTFPWCSFPAFSDQKIYQGKRHILFLYCSPLYIYYIHYVTVNFCGTHHCPYDQLKLSLCLKVQGLVQNDSAAVGQVYSEVLGIRLRNRVFVWVRFLWDTVLP